MSKIAEIRERLDKIGEFDDDYQPFGGYEWEWEGEGREEDNPHKIFVNNSPKDVTYLLDLVARMRPYVEDALSYCADVDVGKTNALLEETKC